MSITVTVLCMALLSGCFLRSIVGWVDDAGGATLSGNVEVGFCDFDTTIPQFHGCTYIIRDDEGFLIEITSTFQLISELGVFGAIIDPLVLQVPADTSNVVATFNNAGSDDPLVVTETASFPVTPGQAIGAEPGTKFLILELPDAVAAALPPGRSDIDFSLSFDVGDPANLFVKPMFTARVDQAGVTYYVPVFPCVSDFASIPASQVPVGTGFQLLHGSFAALRDNAAAFACNQVTYNFANVQPPPTAPPTPTVDPGLTPTPEPTVTPSPSSTPVVSQPSPPVSSAGTIVAATVTPTPTTTPSATATPTSPPESQAQPADQAPAELAFTGTSTVPLVVVGVMLTVVGLVALRSRGRREQD